MDQSRRVQAIAEEIEAYLKLYPHAADTLEGIRDWWLASRYNSLEEIQRALESLIQRGLVERQKLPDGRIIFRKHKRGQD